MLVDTSSILFALKYRKDAFQLISEQLPVCSPAISRGIMREIQGISGNAGKRGAEARAALAALKSKNVKVYNINVNVDTWLLRQAKRTHDIVITNDTELAARLSYFGVNCFKVSRSGRLRRYPKR